MMRTMCLVVGCTGIVGNAQEYAPHVDESSVDSLCNH